MIGVNSLHIRVSIHLPLPKIICLTNDVELLRLFYFSSLFVNVCFKLSNVTFVSWVVFIQKSEKVIYVVVHQ